MTEQEIREIKDAILRSAVKVEDMPVTDSLEGVTTLPCIMGNEYVRVPLPAVCSKKFYPLRATVVIQNEKHYNVPEEYQANKEYMSTIVLRGDVQGMLAEGLVPVLFRRTRKNLGYHSKSKFLRRETNWHRFTDIPGVAKVGDDGLLKIMNITFKGQLVCPSDIYRSDPDAFVFKSNGTLGVIRWGSRRKTDKEGSTLTYGVAFFESDYIKDYRIDWSKQRSEMAPFRVMRKANNIDLDEPHWWGSASE
ncbi:MAG: hypothetical protein SPF56_05310 [Bacteroidaceae bacterium]|nr:hypothetical protein [Bacteroidaceae bacterium]